MWFTTPTACSGLLRSTPYVPLPTHTFVESEDDPPTPGLDVSSIPPLPCLSFVGRLVSMTATSGYMHGYLVCIMIKFQKGCKKEGKKNSNHEIACTHTSIRIVSEPRPLVIRSRGMHATLHPAPHPPLCFKDPRLVRKSMSSFTVLLFPH